jgi:hypothetical protein
MNTGDQKVSIVSTVGVLVFGRVSGKLDEKMEVATFGGGNGVYTSMPVKLEIRLTNKGNTHLRPVGNVFITNMFGKQVASPQVNMDMGSVLPGSSRRFDVKWAQPGIREDASEFSREWHSFAMGKYTAVLALNYGDQNNMQHLSGTYSFWIIPWKLLALILGIIIAIIITLVLIFKGYNKSLIRRYEARKPR